MAEIEYIKSFDVFQRKIRELHDEINSEQERRKADYERAGCKIPARITFEELDLSRFKKNMMAVHKTLQWGEFNSDLTDSEAKKARFVAIAGICELIKDEYVGKFWDMYEKKIGWDKDSTVYNWIWDKGFMEAGIPMLGDERREFVQTLVMESGVPKNRAGDIISFFEIYWRYLRGNKVHDVINLLNENHPFHDIPRSDRNRLKSLADTASEFSRAFALAISKLSTVFEYINESEDICGYNVDEYAERIFQVTGIHPLTILRDRDQLHSLYRKLLGYVTPEKLQRIIDAKPPGTKITAPDRQETRTDYYENILLGHHVIDGAEFVCLPSPVMTMENIKSLPADRLISQGCSKILKSYSEIIPVINSTLRNELVRKLYIDGIFCGNIFFVTGTTASKIAVKTANGIIDTVFTGRDGFVCQPYLHYHGNYRDNYHRLMVKVNSIRFAGNDFKEREIVFLSDQETEPLLKALTDRAGQASCAERSVSLEFPEPGNLYFSAADPLTGETIHLNENPAQVALTLNEVILFSPNSHHQIKPRNSEKPFLFGSRRFILFLHSSISEDGVILVNMEIKKQDSLGEFQINSIKWMDQTKPCQITVAGNDRKWEWSFRKCIHFNLYINRIKDNHPEYVLFRGDQGNRPSDFELVMNPVPDEDDCRELFWNIVVNDSSPQQVRFSEKFPGKTDGKSLRISDFELEKFINPLWPSKSPINANIKISICAADTTLASCSFLVFPHLKVILPEKVCDREEFLVKVELDDVTGPSEILLKNPLGRPKVKIRLDYDNGTWQLRQQNYAGRIEISELETSLDIEAVPPYHAIKFGNREKNRAERVHEILRRELEPYDLIVINDKQTAPEVYVNSKRQKIAYQNSGRNIWYFSLSDLRGIVERENQITICTQGQEETFVIKYRVALLGMDVQKYLNGCTLIGSCSYRGPIGSRIELKLSSTCDDGKTVIHGKKSFLPEGQDENKTFSIELDRSDAEAVERFELTAFLMDCSSDKTGYEYGKRWEVLPESAINEKDFVYLKEKITQAVKNGKPFVARSSMALAVKIVPVQEKLWFSQTEKTINHMLVRSSLNSVANQVIKVLRKEYHFD